MFANLIKGSILHGIDKKDGELKWFTGSVERVSPSIHNQYANTYGQLAGLNVDIVATIDGKQKEYQGVHGGDSIADFGKDTFIIADNKDTLYNYIKSLLKNSEERVDEDNIRYHKNMIPKYKGVLSELRPDVTSASEVKELNSKVKSLESQIAEMLSLLKANSKTSQNNGSNVQGEQREERKDGKEA